MLKAWTPPYTAAVLFSAAMAAGCTQRYATRGLVLRVEPADAARDAARLTISHDAIPRLMDAMVMPFEARDDVPDGIAPGDRIRFRLNVRRDRSWIDRIAISRRRARTWACSRVPRARC